MINVNGKLYSSLIYACDDNHIEAYELIAYMEEHNCSSLKALESLINNK